MVDTYGKHIQKRLGSKCAFLIIESLSSLLWVCWCGCSLGWVLTGLSAQFNSQDQGFFIPFILFIPHYSMTAVVMGDVTCRWFSLRCIATWDSHLSGYHSHASHNWKFVAAVHQFQFTNKSTSKSIALWALCFNDVATICMSFNDLEKDTHLATFPSCLEVLMADLSRQRKNILGLSDQDPAVQSASSTMQESLTSAESRVIQMKMCEKLYRFDLQSKAPVWHTNSMGQWMPLLRWCH